MQDDIIRQMGHITLGARLKRISDKITHSTRLMYKKLDLDIEPNWYLVLIIVEKSPNISVMEIANKLKFSHQSVITITNKMINKGYLESTKGNIDKRKTVFRITQKTVETLPEIQKIWEAGEQVIFEILNGDISITNHLEILESNLEECSFGARIINKINPQV